MYTKCEHCKATFRVKMREITVAKGQLRCGECNQVFNATSSLSTKLPEPYSSKKVKYLKANEIKEDNIPLKNNVSNRPYKQARLLTKGTEKPFYQKSSFFLVIVASLVLLFLSQLAYNYKYLFTGAPQNQPDKIQMLNHNVFAHPNEKGVLLISASMQNTAEHDQPYPILEVRLTNSQSQLVALRRFTPSEYLDNYSKGSLLRINQPTSLKLKIKDPGNKATRFQFSFL